MVENHTNIDPFLALFYQHDSLSNICQFIEFICFQYLSASSIYQFLIFVFFCVTADGATAGTDRIAGRESRESSESREKGKYKMKIYNKSY